LGIAVSALATFALVALLVCRAPSAEAQQAEGVRLFGSSETVNFDISPFPKWTAVLRRYAREEALEDAPCAGPCPLQRWKAFVTSLAGQDRMNQLRAVNAYVNRTPYQTDRSRYGRVDYWATPREFLGQSGDCEDYAITKYFSLRKLGWPAESLRIVVLDDESRHELHAVLIAYLDGTAYVLDNLAAGVLQHAAVHDYRPIFSINEVAWHFHRDWRPGSAIMLAERRPGAPMRTGQGAGRGVASEQAAGFVPPETGASRAAPSGIRAGSRLQAHATHVRATYVRYVVQAPPVRPAARSYSGNAGESLAQLFTPPADRAR
jgi:predicted transglutaminase-like cysteine proteinase